MDAELEYSPDSSSSNNESNVLNREALGNFMNNNGQHNICPRHKISRSQLQKQQINARLRQKQVLRDPALEQNRHKMQQQPKNKQQAAAQTRSAEKDSREN